MTTSTKRHWLAPVALASALALALSGCTTSTTSNSSNSDSSASTVAASQGYPVTVTTYDYNGDEIQTTYDKAPEKVLAVYQGSIESMIALGLEDHVAASYGLDNEVKPEWKAGFEKMNYHEDPFAPDKETVTVLAPDMILSWGSLFSEKNLGDVTEWIEKGTNTYINTNTRRGSDQAGRARTLENEYTDLLNLGAIFNVSDKAEALVNEMKDEVNAAVEASKGYDPVKVMVLEPIDGSITNYNKDSLAGDMVTQLGGTLASPDASEVSKEDIIAADPDVIFVVYMAYSGDDPEQVKADQMALIASDPALASLRAVKDNRVNLVMLGDMYAAGPRTIDGITTFAQGMYPES